MIEIWDIKQFSQVTYLIYSKPSLETRFGVCKALTLNYYDALAFWLKSSGGSDGKRLSTVWETWVRSVGREVPWRRKRQPTPVLLPRKSHGWRSLVSMGSQRVGHDWATSLLMISGLMLVFPCRFIITVTTWFKFSPHVGFAAEVSFLRSHTWSWLSLVHLPHCSQRKLMKSAHNTHHSKV